MKRIFYFLFCLGLVLGAAGCKRSSSTPKRAVLVSQEKDFVYAHAPQKLIEKLKGIPKDPPPVGDPKLAELAAKAKDIADKLKLQTDTVSLGKLLNAFRLETKATHHDLERFRSYLRRKGEIDLYEAVSNNKMEVTFLSFPNAPQHILARNKTDIENLVPVCVGNECVLMKLGEYERRLQEQELQVAWHYFRSYTLPHFTTIPEDQFQQAVVANGSQAKALFRYRQQQPQFIKDPPEPRTLARFKRYLRDNVSPEILAAVAENRIRVNVNADLYNDGDLMVCQGKEDRLEKTNLTIHCNGVVYSMVSAAVIAQKFK